MDRKADRGGRTVSDYLRDKGVVWKFGAEKADVFIYKQFSGRWLRPRNLRNLLLEFRKKKNSVNIIAEPREIAPAAYFWADKARSMVSAPGTEFPHRVYFPSDWYDPKLDDWHKRSPEFVFIGRPMSARIEQVRQLKDLGLPVVIYSRGKWPFAEWKGPCEDELQTSRQYKFRLVFENHSTHKCHTDKLFNGIRAGNVTLYGCDPHLDLSFAKGAFIPFSPQNAAEVYENALQQDEILKGVERFMFTDSWEIYSFREFFRRILNLCPRFV
jgi:hypothetical protein